MKIQKVIITDKAGIALAVGSIASHAKRNRIKGMYDSPAKSPASILKARRSYDFKKEFNRYVDANYGDVLSTKDKKKLMGIVEEHYNEDCIENVQDLKKHIRVLGKRAGIIFD